MAKSSPSPMNAGGILSRLLDQAKEMTNKPVQEFSHSISENVSNQSLDYIDKHYKVIKNETLDELLELIKNQQTQLQQLAEVVKASDGKMDAVEGKLSGAVDANGRRIITIEEQLAGQVEVLREDNRQCAAELKEMIEGNGQVDMEGLMSQQRAHTVEVDRMLMSLKTSLEKNIEKTRGSLEKQIEASAGKGVGAVRVATIFSILNFLAILGYVVYTLVL